LVVDSIRLFGGAGRLAGPIFDKELRVASRRVRSYALRAVYAGALASLILVSWTSAIHSGSGVVLASRMPEVAKTVTTAVTWLQFFAAQGLAVIMLSSAVSEEIRKGTLSALMTSPVSSFQIVVGKLLSRMLQVLMLLAMSLPALAVLRLLGGVPWDYVLAGGCITLTTALCAGAVSLWLSTHCRFGGNVVSAVVLIALTFYIAPWAALLWLASRQILSFGVAATINSVINPFHALLAATTELWRPGSGLGGVSKPWLLNSLVMLGLSFILLALAIRRVRKAAVAAMGGKRESLAVAAGRAVGGLLGFRQATAESSRPIRPVRGSPILWKETRRGLWYGWSLSDLVICAIVLAAILISTTVFDLVGSGFIAGAGLSLAWMLSFLVLLRLALDCAGSVPREREARTWPILLTTLLDDKEIVYGKAKAALLRNAPLLVTLVAAYLFSLVALPRAEMLLLAGWSFMSQVVSVLLVVGLGSCFGVYIKARSAAVVVTIVVYLAMKYVVGAMLIPIVLLLAGVGRFAEPDRWAVLPLMAVPAGIQVVMAVVALRVATLRVRRDIF
jgi:ABC-type transport system involved in multi-copper enzyme maturation permease subunit